MAVVWNISSPLMDGECDRLVPDYESYASRPLHLLAAARLGDDHDLGRPDREPAAP
jgi:hypothetical protein